MSIYPFNILFQNVYPIIGTEIRTPAFYYSLSDMHLNTISKAVWKNQTALNADIFTALRENNTVWGLCGYLEERRLLLSDCPQMVREERYYHLGVDIILPLNTPLFAPLDSVVEKAYYEEGKGNYGGMVLLRHQVNDSVFYSLYGHLNPKKLPTVGSNIKKGSIFGYVGDFSENGDWFYHTHLQILTEKGYQNGWISKGYCSKENLLNIAEFCPNPYFLLFAGLK